MKRNGLYDIGYWYLQLHISVNVICSTVVLQLFWIICFPCALQGGCLFIHCRNIFFFYKFLHRFSHFFLLPSVVQFLLAGLCGLPRSSTSRSEQQVSHCDAPVCLRCWSEYVGPLSLVPTAFKQQDRGLFEVQRYRTEQLMRQYPLRNELLACCILLCLPTMTGAHMEQWNMLKRKSIFNFLK